MKGTDYFVSF